MSDRKEYIERGALLKEAESRLMWNHQAAGVAVYEAIQEAPAADVVEVVRCKDCSWFIAREEGAGDCDMIFGFTSPVNENGYCYCGKRKDGADNAAD